MTLDFTDINAEQPVTMETYEEDGVFAVIVAENNDVRHPVVEFEGMKEAQVILATQMVEAFFTDIDHLN